MPAIIDRFKDWVRHEHPDRLAIFWMVRYEYQSVLTDLRAFFSARNWLNRRRFRAERGLKVQIASGTHFMPGWVNVDVVRGAELRGDLRRKLPFTAGSVSLMFCEHFLDHLQFPDVALRFLSECHRVLEPGGRVRFVLHDAERLMRAYVERDQEFFRTANLVRPTMLQGVSDIMRHNGAHKFLYDFETLERMMRQAGFNTVVRTGWRGSEIAELNFDSEDRDRIVQSMYVEAIK